MTETGNLERKFVNLEEVSSYLYCTICGEIFNNPFRLHCGHTYCKICIIDWSKKNSICPLCRKPFNIDSIQKDLIGYNMVNELLVYCVNKGCCWKDKLIYLNEHVKNCNFDPKKMPETLKKMLLISENKKKKKDSLKTRLGDIENNEEFTNDLSRFNTKVSLKARLYYRNKTLMEKIYSKEKRTLENNKKKECEKESETFLDILMKNDLL